LPDGTPSLFWTFNLTLSEVPLDSVTSNDSTKQSVDGMREGEGFQQNRIDYSDESKQGANGGPDLSHPGCLGRLVGQSY
jgi:hypothetical protein